MKTKSKVDLCFKIIIFAVLALYVLSILYVLFFGLMNSFKHEDDFLYYSGVMSLPKVNPEFPEKFYEALKFGNFKKVLDNFIIRGQANYISLFSGGKEISFQNESRFGSLLLNTLYLAGVCSFVEAFVCYATAYVCAKYSFKFSGFIYTVVICVMTIPLVGTAPATINVLQKLNLFSTPIGMLMMRANCCGMYFLIFYAFFEGLPDSYVEAAEIDGASQFNVFITIIIPMGIKTIGTVTLILFVQNWNDYSMSYVYMPTLPTLAYAVYEITYRTDLHNQVNRTVYKLAGCMILAIPVTIIFVCFKDLIMGNVSAGGLKG